MAMRVHHARQHQRGVARGLAARQLKLTLAQHQRRGRRARTRRSRTRRGCASRACRTPAPRSSPRARATRAGRALSSSARSTMPFSSPAVSSSPVRKCRANVVSSAGTSTTAATSPYRLPGTSTTACSTSSRRSWIASSGTWRCCRRRRRAGSASSSDAPARPARGCSPRATGGPGCSGKLADWNPDLIKSSEGGSNQLLVRSADGIAEQRTLTLARLAGAAAHAVGPPRQRGTCVANLHASTRGRAARELLAAAAGGGRFSEGDPLVFGGDLNLRPAHDPEVFAELHERLELGDPTGPAAIDHLLARGLRVVERPRRLRGRGARGDRSGRASDPPLRPRTCRRRVRAIVRRRATEGRASWRRAGAAGAEARRSRRARRRRSPRLRSPPLRSPPLRSRPCARSRPARSPRARSRSARSRQPERGFAERVLLAERRLTQGGRQQGRQDAGSPAEGAQGREHDGQDRRARSTRSGRRGQDRRRAARGAAQEPDQADGDGHAFARAHRGGARRGRRPGSRDRTRRPAHHVRARQARAAADQRRAEGPRGPSGPWPQRGREPHVGRPGPRGTPGFPGAGAGRSREAHGGVGPSFPITGYDDLTASQVQTRLGTLSPAELRKVRDHERRSAKRKTVLQAIESKLS